ncbi:MAG: threonine/serine exporter family protein [Deltaproteobacteria bacterium]|nr:threonine/serine exporter family protein [Deltaproteobacteria bacterium]
MEIDDAIAFVLALGRALHRYGTPADRLEEALKVSCTRLGVEAEIFTAPTALIMSFGAPTELKTRMMRLEGSELDLGKLEQVDAVADAVIEKRLAPRDGIDRLQAIFLAPPRYGHGLSTLMHGVTSGGLAVFFGGSLEDVAVAGAIGLSLGLLAQYAKRSTDQARVFELVGAAFAAFAAGVVSAMWHAVTPSLVTIAALIILLPGMSLTVAMSELATRHLIAGTARLMSAVIVLLELVVGVALGERAAAALVEVHHATPIQLPAWAPWVALIASSMGMAVVVQAQLRAFGWILAASAVGYLGNIVGTAWLGGQMGAMVGAFALGITGNLFARLLRRPAQVVLVPAVLMLVPGSMGFRGMSSLLSHDTLMGVETVFAMFVVAMAIVSGLLIANAVVSPRRSL